LCPFLTSDKLCSIHAKLGCHYLSDICDTYPRITHIFNGVFEKSLSLSCPEAARLVLLNPEPMGFERDVESTDIRNKIYKVIQPGHSVDKGPSLDTYLWDLREFTIDLLQNREYNIAQRLIILGFFMRSLQERVDEGNFNAILTLIESFNNGISSGVWKKELEKLPVNYDLQMELVKELADIRITKGIVNKKYIQYYIEFINGINYRDDITLSEITKNYRDAYENFYKPFMLQHEYILENYLVSVVFKNIYPHNGSNDVFSQYIILAVYYAMIKMLLIGISGYNRGLSTDRVVGLIQNFSKSIEHNQKYISMVIDLIAEFGYNKMAYMAILINN